MVVSQPVGTFLLHIVSSYFILFYFIINKSSSRCRSSRYKNSRSVGVCFSNVFDPRLDQQFEEDETEAFG